MNIENKFQVIRNEYEHKNNELHEFCRWVEYYSQYYSYKQAKWYAFRTMENLVYKEEKEE